MKNTAHVAANSEDEELYLIRRDADGNEILTRAGIRISRKTLQTVVQENSLTNKLMEVRIEKAKDSACNPVKRAVLATEWEPDV